jgi:hypothetical protein
MKKAALSALVMIAACGGSDSSRQSCNPAGVWSVSSANTSASTSQCQNVASILPPVNRFSIAVNANTLTVQDNTGTTSTAQFNDTLCTASVTSSQSAPTTDAGGTPINVSINGRIDVSFSGNSLAGHQTIVISTTPQEPGTPCTITADFTGQKQ